MTIPIRKLFVSSSSLLKIKNKRYYWEPSKKEELCKEIVKTQRYEDPKHYCNFESNYSQDIKLQDIKLQDIKLQDIKLQAIKTQLINQEKVFEKMNNNIINVLGNIYILQCGALTLFYTFLIMCFKH